MVRKSREEPNKHLELKKGKQKQEHPQQKRMGGHKEVPNRNTGD